MESVGKGKIKNTNVRSVRTKESRWLLYSLLTPLYLVNFTELVYRTAGSTTLCWNQTEGSDIHRSPQHVQKHKTDYSNNTVDDLCPNKACKNSGLIHTTECIVCLWFRVKTAWLWLREKLIELLSDRGPVPDVSNTELFVFMFMYTRIRQEAHWQTIWSWWTASWWTARWWPDRRSCWWVLWGESSEPRQRRSSYSKLAPKKMEP